METQQLLSFVIYNFILLSLPVFIVAVSVKTENVESKTSQSKFIVYNWSGWSKYTPCSTSCGLGVKSRLRHCYRYSKETLKVDSSMCNGKQKSYKTCNSQPCPLDSVNFRELQCSFFNGKLYNGKAYNWTSTVNLSDPHISCSLYCSPAGVMGSVPVLLSQQVIDGTSCSNSGVCAGGKCVKVGCDKELGSNSVYDKCGVCGGAGDSCNTISGRVRRQVQTGYTELLDLPQGSRNILVSEKPRSRVILAMKDIEGIFFFSSHAISDAIMATRGVAGTLFTYSKHNQSGNIIEEIEAKGPINEAVTVMGFSRQEQATVALWYSYEYSYPADHSNISSNINISIEAYYPWRIQLYNIQQAQQKKHERKPLVTTQNKDKSRNAKKKKATSDYKFKRPEQSSKCKTLKSNSKKQDAANNPRRSSTRRKVSTNMTDPTTTNKNQNSDNKQPGGNTRGSTLQSNKKTFVKIKDSLKTSKQDLLMQQNNINKSQSTKNASKPQAQSNGTNRSQTQPIETTRKPQPLSTKITRKPETQSTKTVGKQKTQTTKTVGNPRTQATGKAQTLKSQTDGKREAQTESKRKAKTKAISKRGRSSKRRKLVKKIASTTRSPITTTAPTTTPAAIVPTLNNAKPRQIQLESKPQYLQRQRKTKRRQQNKLSVRRKQNVKTERLKTKEELSIKVATKKSQPENLAKHDFGKRQRKPSKVLYEWRGDKIVPCSTTCEPGISVRFFSCYRVLNDKAVDDRYCDEDEKPSISHHICSRNNCPSRWVAGEWGPCSLTCGEGSQQRQVNCWQILAPGFDSSVHDFLCPNDTKPVHIRKCKAVLPCGPVWEISEWGKCSVGCGYGWQVRVVRCSGPNDSSCRTNRPIEKQACIKKPCSNYWYSATWSACSGSCGIKHRNIFCRNKRGRVVDDGHCDVNKKPLTVHSCGTDRSCDHVWIPQEWRRCPVDCGESNSTRKIICGAVRDGVFKEEHDTYCHHHPRPPDKTKCSASPCGPSWYTTEWGECSKPCGDGAVKMREVKCYHNEQTSDNCLVETQPNNVQVCKLPSCPSNGDVCVDKTTAGCKFLSDASLCERSYYQKACCKTCKQFGY